MLYCYRFIRKGIYLPCLIRDLNKNTKDWRNVIVLIFRIRKLYLFHIELVIDPSELGYGDIFTINNSKQNRKFKSIRIDLIFHRIKREVIELNEYFKRIQRCHNILPTITKLAVYR